MMDIASATPGMDCYEDMFKEITRKLYGEEGMLQTNTSVINGVFNGVINTSHKMSDFDNYQNHKPEDVSNFSLSSLDQNGFQQASQEMMSSQTFQGEEAVDPNAPDQWYMNEENLEWTTSRIASYNPSQKQFRCIDCQSIGLLARVAEHWLGTHTELRVFQCPQCSYSSAWARLVRMHLARQHNASDQINTLWTESPVLGEVIKYLAKLKASVEDAIPPSNVEGQSNQTQEVVSAPGTPVKPEPVDNPSPEVITTNVCTPTTNSDPSTPGSSSGKRYSCTVCPYSTDRRDLFTRHEAIHCEEKPFHCYVCHKQFNRADHVKKHFLRMHRDQPYDLNRIRRSPKSATSTTSMSYYHKYNGAAEATSVNGVETAQAQLQQTQPHLQIQQQQPQQQIMIQTAQPQQQSQHITIPNMASYQATMGSNRVPVSGNGAVLKSASPQQTVTISIGVQQQQQPQQQHQLTGQMTSVITDASKMAAAAAAATVNKEVVVPVSVATPISVSVSAPVPNPAPAEVPKTKGGKEKRYPCPYCSWSGVDNWCLKRHLNTHLKPFVCSLCDYKAARTERLQTHVLKVHNKRTCCRCTFMADDAAQLAIHMQEHHGQLAGDQAGCSSPIRQKRASRKGPQWGSNSSTATATIYQQQTVQQTVPRPPKRWRPKPVGADRLFSYMEASDSEDDMIPEEIQGLRCGLCGCDFLDLANLQTHMISQHERPTRCSLCGFIAASELEIVSHMQKHSSVELHCLEPGCSYSTIEQTSMEEHSRLAHPSLPPLSQKCPHCGFVVLSSTALVRHQRGHHVSTAICSSCSKVLDRFEKHKNGEIWLEDPDDMDENQTWTQKQRLPALRPGVINARRKRLIHKARQIRTRVRRKLKKLLPISKQQQNRKNKKTHSVARRVQKLRQKYIEYRAFRIRLHCFACPLPRRSIYPNHTKGSLTLHHLWRHTRNVYPCESCESNYRHQYQVVLHTWREHVRCPINVSIAEPIVTLTVPQHLLDQLQSQHDLQTLEFSPDQQVLQQAESQPSGDQYQTIIAQAVPATDSAGIDESYDSTRVTLTVPVSVPLVYSEMSSQQEEQPEQQDDTFPPPMYNGMLVPKQIWYPQISTSSYYISTQFPSS